MKTGTLISAIAAGTALAAAGVAAWINREQLPSLRSLKRKAQAMLDRRRERLPQRYDYDHLRFGGLE